MAAAVSDFELWLFDKLRKLNTDEGVFGSYITGILDGDETQDDKKDALEGLLSEIVEKDLNNLISEIIDKWESCKPQETMKPVADVDAQLAKLLDSQAVTTTTTTRNYTDEEKKIREAILSQYSQLCDNEDDQHEEVPESSDLVKNTNASDVAAAARERREQSRLDAQKKKEKDKEDREKQKQLKEEKKEKRKTQKGERKR